MISKNKRPWATKAAMEQVYEKQLWGTNDSGFYSGEGSHLPELTNPYIDVVRSFLNSLTIHSLFAIWAAEILILENNY